MIRSKGLHCVVAGPGDGEELYAEIYYDGKYVFTLNQDQGFDDLELQFLGRKFDKKFVSDRLSLGHFLAAIELAKGRLRGDF